MDSFDDILAALGVNDQSLSADERRSLDDEGYVVAPRMIADDWLAELRAIFERAADSPAINGPAVAGSDTGTRNVPALFQWGEPMRRIFGHPKLLAAAFHVLRRPFRLADMHGRDPQPGFGQQALHADWPSRAAGDSAFHLFNSLWLLDDFTPENGSTRVVPGSHHSRQPIAPGLRAPESRHPDERRIVAPAGSVLLFNGHLLHSGTRNHSSLPRRVIQCSFVATEHTHISPVSITSDELDLPLLHLLIG